MLLKTWSAGPTRPSTPAAPLLVAPGITLTCWMPLDKLTRTAFAAGEAVALGESVGLAVSVGVMVGVAETVGALVDAAVGVGFWDEVPEGDGSPDMVGVPPGLRDGEPLAEGVWVAKLAVGVAVSGPDARGVELELADPEGVGDALGESELDGVGEGPKVDDAVGPKEAETVIVGLGGPPWPGGCVAKEIDASGDSEGVRLGVGVTTGV